MDKKDSENVLTIVVPILGVIAALIEKGYAQVIIALDISRNL